MRRGIEQKTIDKVVVMFNSISCEMYMTTKNTNYKKITPIHFQSAIKLGFLVRVEYGRYAVKFSKMTPHNAKKIIEASNSYCYEKRTGKTVGVAAKILKYADEKEKYKRFYINLIENNVVEEPFDEKSFDYLYDNFYHG